MPAETLEATLDATVALAWLAADIAMKHYHPGIEVDIKNGDPTNMVTQADREVNDLLMTELTRLFPHDGILAEESPASHDFAQRQHHRHLWCIDPIDGTREFVAHSGDFAVMIGLAIDGAARLGVVLQPTEGRVYAGVLGDNNNHIAWTATREGKKQPLQVNAVASCAQAKMMVSRSHTSRGIALLAQGLGVTTLLPMGSVGLKMSMLAKQEAEIYISLSNQTHEWDACGPEAILRAAGGTVTDLDGAQLTYNKRHTPTPRGIVASNGVLHEACLAEVRALEAARRRGH